LKYKHALLPAALASLGFFLSAACGTGGGGSGGAAPVEYPEASHGRSALEFFRGEGLSIGINLGNTLDAFVNWQEPFVASETAWGNPPASREVFEWQRAQGFEVARVPVTWMGHVGPGPGYEISAARMERVAEVVGFARDAGLKVIINMHHDGQTYSDVERGWLSISRALASPGERQRITARFESMWVQIAERFRDYGDWLMFQGFNELHVGDWGSGTALQYEVVNEWNRVFTSAVRRTGGGNADRFLVYSGYNTSFRTAEAYRSGWFRLPEDPVPGPGRQIVNFHFYQPNDFALFPRTHQWPGAGAAGSAEFVDGVFRGFREEFVDRGIPVIIGEIGPARYANHSNRPNHPFDPANEPAARESRLRYVAHVYRSARENGLVPVFWENGGRFNPQTAGEGDFSLIDRAAAGPNSPESAEVVRAMVEAVRGASPPWGD